MIALLPLPDDHPALAAAPLLRAARLTLDYANDHGAIGLTATKAFKRSFVHWAVEAFDWPGFGPDEAFRFRKVVNEYEFTPLQVLHFLLLGTKLGRHYKGEFRLTTRGKTLASSPGALFGELILYFLFETDHSSYGRAQREIQQDGAHDGA